ncbi:hypothetical protein [Curtobacterium sp. SL109]|uniref:hypothetical protein n=1 Tax=Curtobacterium sp. SL109 TaxID=2994662 RepID=UPI002275FEA5|nr:hypothetical protein [Curtobacterium sp. SL109]MCY1694104.1 hypothetical protein [Curtobacterium sp. SL109]
MSSAVTGAVGTGSGVAPDRDGEFVARVAVAVANAAVANAAVDAGRFSSSAVTDPVVSTRVP